MSNNTPQKAIAVTTKYINELASPLKVIADAAVGQQLVRKFSQMYRMPIGEATRFYEREKDNFSKLITQSDALRRCTPMSIYLAFGKVMSLKLSFDNGKYPLVYLIPGNRNIGTKDNPQWISELVAQPSPYGEKEVRINSGILTKVGQPQVVHEGDEFEEFLSDETGEKVVRWKGLGKSTKIKGSFIRLVEPDGTVVFKTFDLTDVHRWQSASAKKNRGTANALYTSGIDGQIDESFLEGKTLSHSFKGYKQVDFAYQAPAGFVPDNSAAVSLNGNYMDDMIDAEYEDQPAGQIGDGGIQYEGAKDDFDKEFETVSKEQPEAEGVKVEVKSTGEEEPNW